MLLRNTAGRFGVVGKLFHWTLALFIVVLIWLGWFMVDLNYYHSWYNDSLTAHKSLGMVALVLAVAKIIWSGYSPAPPLVSSLRVWEKTLARAAHEFLTVAMLVLPVTGYVISTSAGDAVAIFGWFDIPALVVADERSRDFAIEVHYYAAYATLLVVILHAGAALKHEFIDRDGVLRRML